jgi:hypothetical protein
MHELTANIDNRHVQAEHTRNPPQQSLCTIVQNPRVLKWNVQLWFSQNVVHDPKTCSFRTKTSIIWAVAVSTHFIVVPFVTVTLVVATLSFYLVWRHGR